MVYVPNSSPPANMVYLPNSSPPANMVYLPNSSPPLPVATIQQEAGFNNFASRPSVPVKASQYGNLTVGNPGSGSQFSQPVCINKFVDILSRAHQCLHEHVSLISRYCQQVYTS